MPSDGLTGNQPNQISLKLQNSTLNAPWTTQTEIIKTIALNQWQTVNFDFSADDYINFDGSTLSPTQRTDFNRVVLQVNGENNNDHVLAYIDDFSYNGVITAPLPPSPPPVFEKLVWSDEFDEDGPIDSEKWFHQTQLPQGGSWFNGEIQHYTNKIDNSYVADGILNIVAKKERFTDQGVTKNYTSARLNSKFAFTYGKVEFRAKLPTGVGTWPAVWMLGKNISETGAYWETEGFGTTGWPECGEIDIMEHWGKDQNNVTSATHTPSSFGNTFNKGAQVIETASTEFHIYSLEWTAEKIVCSVDGKAHFTYNPPVKDASTWPFDEEQYLLLNIAIEPQIASTFTSSAMEIDYIRIYEEGEEEEEPTVLANQEKMIPMAYPIPFTDRLNIQLTDIAKQNVLLRIYSNKGKLVRTYETEIINNNLILENLHILSEGLYFINFEINNQPYSLKVLKK